MACSGVSLGLGKDCCAGEDAEIPLPVCSTVDDPVVDPYVTNLCSVMASVILDGSTPPPVVALNTDTGSPPTVSATESPAANAVTESLVDVGVTGSPAACQPLDRPWSSVQLNLQQLLT